MIQSEIVEADIPEIVCADNALQNQLVRLTEIFLDVSEQLNAAEEQMIALKEALPRFPSRRRKTGHRSADVTRMVQRTESLVDVQSRDIRAVHVIVESEALLRLAHDEVRMGQPSDIAELHRSTCFDAEELAES